MDYAKPIKQIKSDRREKTLRRIKDTLVAVLGGVLGAGLLYAFLLLAIIALG